MNKTKIARKLRTQEEIRKKVPIFQTDAWEKRKEQIANKVAKKIKKNNKRKQERVNKQ